MTLLAPTLFILAPFNNLTINNRLDKLQKLVDDSNQISKNINNKNIKQNYSIKNNGNKLIFFNQNNIKECEKNSKDILAINDNYSTNEKYNYYINESFTISHPFKLYSNFINSKIAQIIAFLTIIILLIISSIGIIKIKTTFEPSKAFPSNSHLTKSLNEIRLKIIY